MTALKMYTYRICPWVLFGPFAASLDGPGFDLNDYVDHEPWRTDAVNATAALSFFVNRAKDGGPSPLENLDVVAITAAAKPWLEIQVGGAEEDPDWRYAKAFSPKLGGYLPERLKTAFKYRAPAAALYALGFVCPPKGYVTIPGTHESAAAAAEILCKDVSDSSMEVNPAILEVLFTNKDVDGNALFGADSPHTLTAPNGEAPGAYWGRVRMRIEGPNQDGYLKNLPDWAYVSTVPLEFGGTRNLHDVFTKAAESLENIAEDGADADAVETDQLQDPASLGVDAVTATLEAAGVPRPLSQGKSETPTRACQYIGDGVTGEEIDRSRRVFAADIPDADVPALKEAFEQRPLTSD
jgi:hypothetical protein